jgi:lysophospholipase L1-like esterase
LLRLFVLGLMLLQAAARVCIARVMTVVTGANPAVVPVPKVEGWWVARHAERSDKVKAGGVDLLFVGDSITQNYDKKGPAPDEVFTPIWEELFAPHHALNLGYSGDQTQHVLWRLRHGEVDGLTPKDIVVLIGTNNTPDTPGGTRAQTAEEVAAGVIAVVEELHARLPGAKILVVEVLPSAVSEKKSSKDAVVNSMLRLRHGVSKGSYARCLDLSSLFMKDGVLDASLYYDPRLNPPKAPLHPDVVGQRKMAVAVRAALFGAADSGF